MRPWLLAGMLAACHGSPFDELVTAANARWEVAICRTPRYSTIEYVAAIPQCGLEKGDIWGCYTALTGELRVSQTTESEYLLQVITHEMGHSFLKAGIHAAPGAGIMSAYVMQATPNITAADIELLCEDYECPCRNPEAP